MGAHLLSQDTGAEARWRQLVRQSLPRLSPDSSLVPVRRLLIPVLAAFAVARALAAQESTLRPTAPVALPTSAPIADVHYDVTLDSAGLARRSIGIVMTFRVAGPGPVVLALPAWTPGHYTLLWFTRRVSHFAATASGTPLAWRHIDYQTWRIDAPAGGTVSIAFDYRADTVDRAAAWTHPDFAFFNGTNLFLYPVGRGFDWPATVTVHIPPTWRIATGMTPTADPTTFGERTYHDLVDMPFFVGRFAIDSTEVAAGHWMRLAWYPESIAVANGRLARNLAWAAKLAPVQGAVFHELPWRTYTVLYFTDSIVNGGGLEHQNSQVDEIQTKQIDGTGIPWLYSHELFHSWNVKRLRPADLVPYRYDDAQPTPWLWVSEGVTDYYGPLAIERSGIADSAAFFHALARDMTSVAGAPPVAPADASLSAWVQPKDGSAGLYYPQGALLGFALDIVIRDASDNRHSLDDVMRELYETTYKKKGRGFTSADWWRAVSRAAGGISFADFNRRYVEGRDTIPWATILPLAGLTLTTDSTHTVHVDPAPDASPKAVRVRAGLLHGTTDG